MEGQMTEEFKNAFNAGIEFQRDLQPPAPFNASKDCGELFGALAKAQGGMDAAKKEVSNTFFKSKYADLHSCWEAIRKPFADNGLSVIQNPSQGEQFDAEVQVQDKETKKWSTHTISGRTVVITTVLAHTSGQWMSNIVELKPVKVDPQGMGSAMTYARRYGLMAIAGIAPEDDDGNAASQPGATQYNRQPSAVTKDRKVVSTAQLSRLRAIASSADWANDDVSNAIKKLFKLDSSKKLNMKQYDELIDMIQKNTPQEAADVLAGDAINGQH